jgi:hypothetical protein
MTQTKSWGRKFEANQAALRVLYERQERLHDAAPELLDALKTARRVVLTVACGTTAAYIREALEVIDAALAKAEAAMTGGLTPAPAVPLIRVCAWHTPKPEIDRLNQQHPGSNHARHVPDACKAKFLQRDRLMRTSPPSTPHEMRSCVGRAER